MLVALAPMSRAAFVAFADPVGQFHVELREPQQRGAVPRIADQLRLQEAIVGLLSVFVSRGHGAHSYGTTECPDNIKHQRYDASERLRVALDLTQVPRGISGTA